MDEEPNQGQLHGFPGEGGGSVSDLDVVRKEILVASKV